LWYGSPAAQYDVVTSDELPLLWLSRLQGYRLS